ncbi:hypothetical protein ILYODFUR_002714 [Ilyodon furcidens]|uniref:Uncharacterized protein n=1 Tax=Ilyodon furcidens TaxID=33524 RepID=A0ABV0T4S2_9TELE
MRIVPSVSYDVTVTLEQHCHQNNLLQLSGGCWSFNEGKLNFKIADSLISLSIKKGFSLGQIIQSSCRS